MSGRSVWRWFWENSPAEASAGLPASFVDVGDPFTLEGAWGATRLSIYALASRILRLTIDVGSDMVMVSGIVSSEATKSRLLALLARHAREIVDDLEVAPPFKSATRPGEAREEDPVPSRTVRRHPLLTSSENPVPGRLFEFSVDLLTTPHPDMEGSPVEIAGASPGWSELSIDVQVICAGLRFGNRGENATIVLRSDGTSTPAVFRAMPTAHPGEPVELNVTVSFFHRGRYCGGAYRAFRSVETLGEAHRLQGASSFDVEPDVQGPHLTLQILRDGATDRYVWAFHAPRDLDHGGRTVEVASLGTDTRSFAQDLMAGCPNLAPGRHESGLRGIGERIWEASPTSFRSLYRAMYERYGRTFPIQILTDEPFVPWEMMFPVDENSIKNPDHLFMTHPIARWFPPDGRPIPRSIPRGRIASFTPTYVDGSHLACAQEEGDWLSRELQADRRPTRQEDFVAYWSDAMPEEKVGILHFAGHGSSRLEEGGAPWSELRFSDGNVTPNDVHGGVGLGRRDGTFVILNACSTGAGEAELGCADGFAVRLASRGFSGVLAPIWAVRDTHASHVVCEHVWNMVEGHSLGACMRDARRRHRRSSSTAFSYLCHGDVMARMV